MDYYALFLKGDEYITNCISLIKYINMPKSKSFPHVTFRLLKDSSAEVDNFYNSFEAHYINILKPSDFNIENNSPPYIINLRCQSHEFEIIQYKPDFPQSFLHITLYEGTDLEYAKDLLAVLNEIKWNIRVKFDSSAKLTRNIVGQNVENGVFQKCIPVIYKKILGEEYDEIKFNSFTNKEKIDLVRKILKLLENYCSKHRLFFDKTEETQILKGKKSESENSNIQSNIFNGFENSDKDIQMPTKVHITPPELAFDMASSAVNQLDKSNRKIDFGDPAIGTGMLFLALKKAIESNKTVNYSLNSAIGIDINDEMLKTARERCGNEILQLVLSDALFEISNRESRNLILCNPPYDRREQIPASYKEQIYKLAYDNTNIKVPSDAGLYVYHILIMDKWLKEGGIAAWLIPPAFLQSRYGLCLRNFLLNNVQLLQLHIYSKEMFEKVSVKSCLVVYKKCSKKEDYNVSISYGISTKNVDWQVILSKSQLNSKIDNWNYKKFFSDSYSEYNINCALFKDLFDIKRGIATGANSFFVMSLDRAKELKIPKSDLKPILPKARFLDDIIINADEYGYPQIPNKLVVIDSNRDIENIRSKYPEYFDYLESAKFTPSSKPIIKATLVQQRMPLWYKQENRLPAPFLLTYMGRGKNKPNLPPLYFILNKSKAIALNTYIMLYPKPWLQELLDGDNNLYELLLDSLNKTAREVLVKESREYSGKLHKFEPGELTKQRIMYLPQVIIDAWQKTILI